MICWAKQQQQLISKDSSLYRREKIMPSNKQSTEPQAQTQNQKIRCFANRFTNITLTKSSDCPPASDIEKEFRLMQQKRDEQDKKLFGSK